MTGHEDLVAFGGLLAVCWLIYDAMKYLDRRSELRWMHRKLLERKP